MEACRTPRRTTVLLVKGNKPIPDRTTRGITPLLIYIMSDTTVLVKQDIIKVAKQNHGPGTVAP